MEMENLLLFTSLLIISIIRPAFSSNVPAIFTFGDSIFDAGNNHYKKNCTVQADFPPYGRDFFHRPTGRFTNGRNVVDFISEFLGVDLQKPYGEVEMQILNGSSEDFPRNGINFASAGSGLLNQTNNEMGVTPIRVQLQQFEDLVNQNKIDKKTIEHAFFFFESGSNDVFEYFLFSDTKSGVDAFVDSMWREIEFVIQRVYKLGARKIAAFGLGPVGCIPARVLLPGAPIDECFEEMNHVVMAFNSRLEGLVKDIPARFPGAIAVYGATYELVQLFRSFPKHYGFLNISSACCGGGPLGGMVQCGTTGYSLCENPDEFLFWDFFHPSQHSYELLSKAFWYGKQKRIRPFNLKTLANITLLVP